MVLEVIKSHVKNRGVGYATKSSCRQNSDCHWQKLEIFFARGMTAIWQPKPSLFSLIWGLRAPAFLQVRDLVLPTSYGVDRSLCIRDLSSTAFHCATGSKRYGLQLADRIYLIGPTGHIQEAWAVIGLVQYKNTLYTAQLPFIGHDQPRWNHKIWWLRYRQTQRCQAVPGRSWAPVPLHPVGQVQADEVTEGMLA